MVGSPPQNGIGLHPRGPAEFEGQLSGAVCGHQRQATELGLDVPALSATSVVAASLPGYAMLVYLLFACFVF